MNSSAIKPNPARAPVVLLVFFVSSFLEAESASCIWGWFLAGYGAGPTLGQWFGIAILVALLVRRIHANPNMPEPYAPDANGKPKAIGDILADAGVMWFSLVVMLVLAWGVGFVFHWMAP